MHAASLFGRSTAADSSVLWTDPLHHFSLEIENQALEHLEAELRSESGLSTSGILLGFVRHENCWTSVELGACLLLKSGIAHITSDQQDEQGLAIELSDYPLATSGAPGRVGYFIVGAIGQTHPTAAERELFTHRFTDDAQVFVFARRSDTGELSPQVYIRRDRTLVPVPLYVRPEAKFVVTKSRVWVACAVLTGILVVGGVLFSNRQRVPIATMAGERPTIMPKLRESHPFQLAVSREADSLKLSWDAQAFAIRSAQMGILVIEDGERYVQQILDSADLRNGQLGYVPASLSSNANIRFRMDLVSEIGEVESASVRLIGMAPQGVADVAVATPLTADILRARVATPVRLQPNSLPAQSMAPKNVAEVAVPSPPLTADTVRARDATTVRLQPNSLPAPAPTEVTPNRSPVTVPVAPPPITASAKPIPPIEPQTIERPPPPPPEVPSSPARSAVAEAPARLPITQVTNEPRVKRSVKPSIPLGLQSMLRSGSRTPVVIPVKVRIDPSGEVTSAQADYPQSSVFEKQLVNLVQTTARYWTFDPATINGKPVVSELVINFKF